MSFLPSAVVREAVDEALDSDEVLLGQASEGEVASIALILEHPACDLFVDDIDHGGGNSAFGSHADFLRRTVHR